MGFGFVIYFLIDVVKVIVYDRINGYQCGGVFYRVYGFFKMVQVIEYLVKVVDDIVRIWVGFDGVFDYVKCFIQFDVFFDKGVVEIV